MNFLSPRILIIDDDPDNCELIQLLLEYSDPDYETTCVLTAEEGLQLAATRRFDLYLLDFRLSGINGVEVCRRLRRTEADTPIVFFTGEAQERARQEALRAGADDYLIKPDDLGKLTSTVQRLLGMNKLAGRRRDMTVNHYRKSELSV